MKNIFFLFAFLILVNCNLNKVNNTHGSLNLKKKHDKLTINLSNKNDIIQLLGPPSTKSQFNNNKWFYIERKITNTSLVTLGRKKIYENNVLVLEIDKNGILKKKEIMDMTKMNELKFSENSTGKTFKGKSFLYNFMSSLREKINAPIKKAITKKKN
tara:strand:+ start:32 stop:502 length:471 start_codon:yes stop_codon:yes gene_type:complete